jgi:hypothetical protein
MGILREIFGEPVASATLRGDTALEASDAVGFYNAEQPRDEHGRWGNNPGPPWASDVRYVAEQSAAWVATLTRPEAAALDNYKGSSFYPINMMLRDPKWPETAPANETWGTRGELRMKHANEVSHLDDALAKSVLSQHLMVHRGVSRSAKAMIEAFDTGALQPGVEVTDAGFASASLSAETGDKFKSGWGRSGPGMVLHIKLKPGDKAGHIGLELDHQQCLNKNGFAPPIDPLEVDAEQEMLLPRETVMRVVKAYTIDGARHLDLEVARQPTPTPASFAAWDPALHPRGEHGKWASIEGATESASEAGDAVVGEAPFVPTPNAKHTPADPAIVDKLESQYRKWTAPGSSPSDDELDSWRYGLASHTWQDINALGERLGIDVPDHGVGMDVHQQIVNKLYKAVGLVVPHPGDNRESQQKLAEWKEAIARGIDPGQRIRLAARKWLYHEAAYDQIKWIAKELGVPLVGDRPADETELSIFIREKLTHPGSGELESSGVRQQITDTLAGTIHTPTKPAEVAKIRKKYGKDAIVYLCKCANIYKPGMKDKECQKALEDALVEAGKSHGKTAESEGLAEALARRASAEEMLTGEERAALREALRVMSWKEVSYIHRSLGLDAGQEKPSVGDMAREDIIRKFSQPIAERMRWDMESKNVVKAMAAVHDAVIQARDKNGDVMQKIGDEIGSIYTARAALPTPEERQKYMLDNQERLNKLQGESMALASACSLNLHQSRTTLRNLMRTENPVAWKIKNDSGAKDHKAAIEAGVDFYRDILNRGGAGPTLAEITLRKTKTRARAWLAPRGGKADPQGVVWLSSGSVQTAVHELGHQIEFHMPGVKAAARDFLMHRVGSEPLTSLAKKFPDHGYKKDEFGRQDDFGKVFGPDSHKAYYCGKSYDDGSTEIISMGTENLYNNPAEFCAKDPEYAQFIIGILTGRLR